MKKLVGFIVLVLVLLNLSIKIKTIPLHPDEYDYVARGVFAEFYIRGNFFDKVWQTYDSYVQEKLPSYMYASWLKITNNKQIFEWKSIKHSDAWIKMDTNFCSLGIYSDLNCQTIIQSEAEDGKSKIYVARILAMLVSIGSLFLFKSLVELNSSWIGGWIGFFLLYFNPVFQSSSLRAMGDTFLIFFLIWGWCLIVKWFREISVSNSKKMFYSAEIGLAFGLAMSSKINGAMGLFVFYTLGLLNVWLRKIFYYDWVKTVVVSTSVAGVVFVAINPFLWSHTTERLQFMVENRTRETSQYQIFYPDMALVKIQERPFFLLRSVLVSQGSSEYLWLGLVVIGLVKVIRNLRNRDMIVGLIWFLVVGGIMVLYVGMKWDRYFLPLIPVIIMFECIGVEAVVNIFRWKVRDYKLHKLLIP